MYNDSCQFAEYVLVRYTLKRRTWAAWSVSQSATKLLQGQAILAKMATLQDRFNINSQLEHLQAKYVGTGHADLGRFEWAVNVHRDSYASYIGHHPLVSYFAIAENESVGRKKYDLMQKMLLPCGFPPAREEEVE